MLETIKTKVCTKCKVEKSVEEFSKANREKDGLQPQCKECIKAYYQANSEKISVNQKAYYQANAEKILVNHKAYREANAEKYAEYHKAYREANRDKISVNHKAYQQTPIGKAVQKNASHKRRSITRQGDVTTQQLLELQNNAKTCYWCGVSLKSKEVHIDHYVPLSKGGEHTLSNLAVSCAKCNQTKSVKDPVIFAQSIGKLF